MLSRQSGGPTMEIRGQTLGILFLAWLALGTVGSVLARASGPKINKNHLQSAVRHFLRGRTLDDQGVLTEAVSEYREALREDPDEPYWYQTLGAALEKGGDTQEALEAYSRATQLSPDDPELRSELQQLQKRLEGGSGTTEAAPKSPDAAPRFNPGGNVSPPSATYSPDPSYSEKARLVKYSGTVLLAIVVDAQGNVREIRDVKPLGLGLDEDAIEAVRTWRFKPGMRDGTPVATRVAIEVSFRIQ